MDGSDHDDNSHRINGLISPVLTPVAEEPPSLPQTVSHIVSGDVIITRESSNVDNFTAKRNRANSLPSRARPSRSDSALNFDGPRDAKPEIVLKLSAARISELISEPNSLPVLAPSPFPAEIPATAAFQNIALKNGNLEPIPQDDHEAVGYHGRNADERAETMNDQAGKYNVVVIPRFDDTELDAARSKNQRKPEGKDVKITRPTNLPRSISVPFPLAKQSTGSDRIKLKRAPSKSTGIADGAAKAPLSRSGSQKVTEVLKSPPLPLPPLSIPTHLHLELSADRPSPLYIYRNHSTSTPYESSRVKFERLLNFLLLPPQLEQVLLFGTLTCLDAWLYVFTILPLRFLKAVWILSWWTIISLTFEILALPSYVFHGLARLWRRRMWSKKLTESTRNFPVSSSDGVGNAFTSELNKTNANGSSPTKTQVQSQLRARLGGKRLKAPSPLQAGHKADILQGLIIIFSCVFLMRVDASRMYHAIRGQAAIKLYVIYNVLEVCDRLFSALGQDIMDCLFSAETLDRKPNGRSRIIRPFWMFLLALAYTVFHSMAFFYQVITLNVAVNSYSNALLTLLMSNQFVEIKGTVFKKIEKENLFQLTCADVVERFQLWLMLLVIAMRNIVELGGLSASSGDFPGPSSSGSANINSTTGVPFRTFGILPQSFTLLPSSFPAQVFSPFLIVLGSEMAVDWLKHAYISKFNATTPAVYGRFLDVLSKDYYSNAFAEQNLTRRLGLPVIPLACLFIRAALQTYHMFLATNVSAPIATTTTSLSLETHQATSLPVIAQIDHIFRSALGRSSFGAGVYSTSGISGWATWTLDDLIALTTMLVFFLALYLLLLVFKLCLGMVLLRFARDRYRSMKVREKQSFIQAEAKRLGGWGTVELGDERRKVIYEGDAAGLKAMRDREAKLKELDAKAKAGDRLDGVERYSMVGKRIW